MLRCFLFILCPFILAAEGEKRPMTIDDGLKMVNVSDVLISPDGSWVFFSKSELDWAKNKRKKTYYKVSSDGGEAFQYIGEDGGSSFQFSPKGTWLSFMRGVGKDKKERQVFIMRNDGGEAVQLTKHKKGISSYKWSADESRLILLADEPREEDEEKEHKNGKDAIFVDEGPNGQTASRWNNLWLFDVKTKKETRITEEKMRVSSYDLSPDNSRIVYTARYENRRNQGNLAEIYLVTVQDKVITKLTDNKAPESNVSWAPNGRDVAYFAPDDKDWELRQSRIWIMDADARTSRSVSDPFKGNIRGMFWTPDSKTILFNGLWRTDTNLHRLALASGKLTRLTDFKGSFRAYGFSKDRQRYVYGFHDFDTPQDLHSARTDGKSDPVRLTKLNEKIEKEILFAKSQLITWKSKDGLEIEGILQLPAGYREGTRIPLLLHIHGGPAGVFTNSFRYRNHIYSGLGYAQLSPNVRGSTGYGDDLLRGNMKDIGGGDYQDLMTGVDHVIEKGWADAERMGVTGWSYGGILGGWTITQTNRFKAASLGAMVSDWTSEYGPGFNYDVVRWYIGGTPWDNPDDWRFRSALTHVAKVQTPTILLHGMKDTTCTEPQSMMFYAALKDRGVPVRYIRFPRQPHGLREPRHQRIRIVEEARWLQKHVQGRDWEPWPYPKSKKEKKDK
ncbi:MAG: S9 family peptidase [Acidobacteriota bacterium]|nr:S9 family peptidase [Acidobacteriota bacterium]